MEPLTLKQFISYKGEGAIVLDTRTADQFCEGHIPGSWYTPARVLKDILFQKQTNVDNQFVLVVEQPNLAEVQAALNEAALEVNTLGYLQGGFASYKQLGNPQVDVVVAIDADELVLDLQFAHPHLIDLRSEVSFQAGHVVGAEHIPAENLLDGFEVIPKDKTFYLYSKDGDVSLFVISLLKTDGLHYLYQISGGYDALTKAGAPVAADTKKSN